MEDINQVRVESQTSTVVIQRDDQTIMEISLLARDIEKGDYIKGIYLPHINQGVVNWSLSKEYYEMMKVRE